MQIHNQNQNEPLLSFEFASSTGEIKPIIFSQPLKVMIAYTLEEVLPCFQMIQEAIRKGYYAAGYLSYESAPAFDSAFRVNEESTMPLLWFAIFNEPQTGTLNSGGTYKHSNWIPSVSLDEYDASIQYIKHRIEAGDTYQANYTIRLHSEFEGDDISFFNHLKKAQASNYCAYLNTGDHRILSASPELFFHLKGNQITTRPMKGTIKRGNSYSEDKKNANWLYHSEKNRAENVMIVDLLRNDLGMIAQPGTVEVPKLFEMEHYPTVHQMTSTITAKLSENIELVDIFKALFPCGSITGAPKIKTMEIISELETTPRNVYCGAIGYITPNQEAIFNVPIRTVVIEQKTGIATYGVGGGITWDSTTEGEYHEILSKAKLLEVNRPEFQLLESLLLHDGELFLLDEHLNRLSDSAQYFGFPFNPEPLKQSMLQLADQYSTGHFKVRLLLDKTGEFKLEAQPISEPDRPLKVALADESMDKNNPFFYHKTTNRAMYSYFQQKYPHVYDVLLWNENGEITEFTNGNVVLEMDGYKWTPPISSGLLAGTFRESLLNDEEIHERVLTVEDLKKCTKIWFINSVRRWLEVEFI
ncbi:aminodeoxychorismate synthase component I [Niallia endozanthoxylica]|uniref:Aminodeoxychorismate synthase component I n=1 Tax=Niallia endozanthoxylica TaxID=2036016 RepID=A0A5J5HRG6_9BACI|nr:aminodeoxychorismate synthase component I [Niallia endozanthoxylica]KAA9024217.1 aminodeoxychorismate synthase component I [Niallia endozanthoxylica]